jgi:low affinity Fe/Cu permease
MERFGRNGQTQTEEHPGCVFKVRGLFRFCAQKIALAVGSPAAFTIAVAGILIWALTGPAFHYSDTWQLVINTATTIITFLMVFLIQNTQNRDTKALHLKLDELLRGVKGARSTLINLESLSDEELDKLQAQFERIRRRLEKQEAPTAPAQTRRDSDKQQVQGDRRILRPADAEGG